MRRPCAISHAWSSRAQRRILPQGHGTGSICTTLPARLEGHGKTRAPKGRGYCGNALHLFSARKRCAHVLEDSRAIRALSRIARRRIRTRVASGEEAVGQACGAEGRGRCHDTRWSTEPLGADLGGSLHGLGLPRVRAWLSRGPAQADRKGGKPGSRGGASHGRRWGAGGGADRASKCRAVAAGVCGAHRAAGDSGRERSSAGERTMKGQREQLVMNASSLS